MPNWKRSMFKWKLDETEENRYLKNILVDRNSKLKGPEAKTCPFLFKKCVGGDWIKQESKRWGRGYSRAWEGDKAERAMRSRLCCACRPSKVLGPDCEWKGNALVWVLSRKVAQSDLRFFRNKVSGCVVMNRELPQQILKWSSQKILVVWKRMEVMSRGRFWFFENRTSRIS